MEDIDLSKNTLFLRMMPRIDYNRKRGSLRSVSGRGGEGREGRGEEGREGERWGGGGGEGKGGKGREGKRTCRVCVSCLAGFAEWSSGFVSVHAHLFTLVYFHH